MERGKAFGNSRRACRRSRALTPFPHRCTSFHELACSTFGSSGVMHLPIGAPPTNPEILTNRRDGSSPDLNTNPSAHRPPPPPNPQPPNPQPSDHVLESTKRVLQTAAARMGYNDVGEASAGTGSWSHAVHVGQKASATGNGCHDPALCHAHCFDLGISDGLHCCEATTTAIKKPSDQHTSVEKNNCHGSLSPLVSFVEIML